MTKRPPPTPGALARKAGDALPAEFVADYRKRNGFTRAELAMRLGVFEEGGEDVVAGWETGQTKCEGPAAEFLLHLSGQGNAVVEIPAFVRTEVDNVWNRDVENALTAWRQIVAVPRQRIEIAHARFTTLFPEASLPPSEVQHGFPFTGEDLPGDVCQLTPSGWLGAIPASLSSAVAMLSSSSIPSTTTENESEVWSPSPPSPPRYMWRFTRDGKFAYREYLWEGHASSPTRGNFDLGSIVVITLQTAFFLRRLGSMLKLDDSVGYTLQLDLRGASGRGVAMANTFFPDPTRTTSRWTTDSAASAINTTMRELRADAVSVGLQLAADVTSQVSAEFAQPKLLRHVARMKLESTGRLGFLRSVKL
jgi:transcriptional regulator with XRE-family HTH domain